MTQDVILADDRTYNESILVRDRVKLGSQASGQRSARELLT
jgi:hypothetical protein